MQRCNSVMLVVAVILAVLVANPAFSQDKATASEIVTTVKNAASTLAKTGEPGLADFNKKAAPWVWKDSYVFVLDCGKGLMAAHPLKPELIGKDVLAMKDTQGKAFFGELCGAGKKASGLWVEYTWPKPGETVAARKISYAYGVSGTPYVVAAGIYDDKISLAELEKISAGN